MGINDHLHCREGWHARAEDGRSGVTYRWTGAAAAFRLAVPAAAKALHVLVSGPALLTGRPVPLTLYAGDACLGCIADAAASDTWTIARFALDNLAPPPDGREIGFSIRPEEPGAVGGPALFVPDRYLHNGDFRPLGIMVAAIRAV